MMWYVVIAEKKCDQLFKLVFDLRIDADKKMVSSEHYLLLFMVFCDTGYNKATFDTPLFFVYCQPNYTQSMKWYYNIHYFIDHVSYTCFKVKNNW